MKNPRRFAGCLAALVFAAPLLLAQSNPQLEDVLTKMDEAAAHFRSTEADFVWDQYMKVVDQSDSQKGKVYFKRSGSAIQMAADIREPEQKYVLYADAKVQVYQPRIDQITVYDAGKNKDAFESFLVLGFGGRGHDLSKSFDVKYAGTEKLGSLDTAKLELVPKSQSVRNNFSRIILWIDPQNGVSVQQQFFEPSGDYRLAKYSGIKINHGIADNAFKIKTTRKTKTVSPSS
jgi:outer membrane lipoprotein-sorting protein